MCLRPAGYFYALMQVTARVNPKPLFTFWLRIQAIAPCILRGDGSVEAIGEVHPVMPDNATLRFNIASGNQTLFGINNTGMLSVNVTNVLQNRTHYLGIEEEYAGGNRFFANVTVFGRTPIGGNITHYVYWLAENEWLKPDRIESLPKY